MSRTIHFFSSAGIDFFVIAFLLSLAVYFIPKLKNVSELSVDSRIHFWTMVVFAVVVYFFHKLWATEWMYDEEYLHTEFSSYYLTEFFLHRYMTWIFGLGEPLTRFFTKFHMDLWRAADTLVIVIIVEMVIQTFLKKENRRYAFFPCLLALLVPKNMLNSSGWIMTTTAYVWPVAYFLPFAYVAKCRLLGEKVSAYLTGVSIVFVICAGFAVQITLIFLLSSALFIFYKFFLQKTRKVDPYFMAVFVISILMVVFAAAAPGLKIRAAREMHWYEGFDALSLLDKVKLGIIVSISYFFSIKEFYAIELNFIIIPLQIGLFFKFLFDKNYRLLAVQILIGAFVVFFGYFPALVGQRISLPGWLLLFRNVELAGRSAYSAAQVNFQTFVFLLILAGTLVSIYYALGKSYKGAVGALIFFAGFCTRCMMGFSPTVYISGARTAVFMALSIFIVTTLVWQEIDLKKLKPYLYKGLFAAMFLFCLALTAKICLHK